MGGYFVASIYISLQAHAINGGVVILSPSYYRNHRNVPDTYLSKTKTKQKQKTHKAQRGETFLYSYTFLLQFPPLSLFFFIPAFHLNPSLTISQEKQKNV